MRRLALLSLLAAVGCADSVAPDAPGSVVSFTQEEPTPEPDDLILTIDGEDELLVVPLSEMSQARFFEVSATLVHPQPGSYVIRHADNPGGRWSVDMQPRCYDMPFCMPDPTTLRINGREQPLRVYFMARFTAGGPRPHNHIVSNIVEVVIQ